METVSDVANGHHSCTEKAVRTIISSRGRSLHSVMIVPFVFALAPDPHHGLRTDPMTALCNPDFTSCTPGTIAHVAKLEHITALNEKHGVLSKRAEPCSGTHDLGVGTSFATSVEVPYLGHQSVRILVTKPGEAAVSGSGILAISCGAARYHQDGQTLALEASSCPLPPSIRLSSLRFCSRPAERPRDALDALQRDHLRCTAFVG
jgi:hypothetical protein